jgi:hypothetical protein
MHARIRRTETTSNCGPMRGFIPSQSRQRWAHHRWWRRSCLVGAVLALASLGVTTPSHAALARGAEVQLHSIETDSAGTANLFNTGSGAVSTAVIAVGQATPTGVSSSPSSGVSVDLGLLPRRLMVPEPSFSVLEVAAFAALAVLAGKRRRLSPSAGCPSGGGRR